MIGELIGDAATDSESITESRSELRQLVTVIRRVYKRPQFGRDVLLLFVVPIGLFTLVHLTTTTGNFVYDIDNPTIWGIYTSNIAHWSWGHLAANTVGYLIIGGCSYLLLSALGRRRQYIGVLLAALLVFPLFTHGVMQYLLLTNPQLATYSSAGFSEPVAALTGYFPVVLALYHAGSSDFQHVDFYTTALVCSGFGWAAASIAGLSVATAVIMSLGVVGLGVLAYHLATTAAVETRVARLQYTLTTALFVFTYLALVYGLFAGDVLGTQLGHMAGFTTGGMVAIVVSVVPRFYQDSS